MRSFPIILLLVLTALISRAQSITISGKVVDAATLKPIELASVYIVNTSFGTSADNNGNFSFQSDNIAGGDIIVSFIGYDTYRKRVVFGKEPINLGAIRLNASETVLNEVVVKASRDKAWEKDLKKFSSVFLGKDAFAEECTIQNPWVIDIDNSESTFTAKSVSPIVIINNALGYMVKFSLKRLVSNTEGYSIEGDAYFMALAPPTSKEGDRWTKNRNAVYRRSVTNLLRSMVNKTSYGEGFVMYTELSGGGGSFTRMSRFSDNLGKKLQLADTNKLVSKQPGTDKFIVTIPGRVEVHYLNEGSRIKVYQDIVYPISWITTKSTSVVVNASGFPADPTAVTVSGAMSEDRLSRMLPIDYSPDEKITKRQQHEVASTLPFLYEKIYMHTAKPFYHPGDQLWFKGYVNYQSPILRDSLSSTVYVDLIAPTKKIVASKVLQLDSGRFIGEIDIPNAIDAGTYNVRAYTNLQRNFGDSTLYLKPIAILDIQQSVENIPTQPTIPNEINIATPKEKFKPREKIEVTVHVVDSEGRPLHGDLSMSVTDIRQVSPVHTSSDITQVYPIGEPPAIDQTVIKSPFIVEHGITIKGRFKDNAGKPVKASLNVIQMNPKRVEFVESDLNGDFVVNHLMIYDSARFSITSTDRKGKIFGKATILDNDKPRIYHKDLSAPIRISIDKLTTRVYAKGNDSAKVLQEVEIRGAKVREEYTAEYRVKRPYGRPDYILDSKNFTSGYSDLLVALRGRFPGLIIRQASSGATANSEGETRWVVYLQRNERGSIARGPQEVLVTIDDAIMGGTPESILGMIHPDQVESVELRSRANVLYGNVSNGGVLAIYLKKGQSIATPETKTIGTVSATGYTFTPNFTGPDYDREPSKAPDYRALIHWEPIIPINNGVAKISFFAADLATTYQIEIEGVTSEGKPVRAIKLVVVGE
jgi:hypothetical protein